MNTESCGEIFGKFSVTFHENPSSVSQFIPCGWTGGQNDMTNLIVVFIVFANAPKTVPTQDNYIRYTLVKMRYIKKHIIHEGDFVCKTDS